MYNYNQANPYQQNVGIIKSFFKKPLILATTIISFIASALLFFSEISNYVNPTFSISGKASILLGITSFGSFAFAVVISVFWFLFYKASKTSDSNSNPAKPFSGLWICSIITLVATGLISLLLIIGGMYLLFNVYTMTRERFLSGGYAGVSFSIELLQTYITVAVVFILVLTLIILSYAVSNFLYIRAIKNSMTSIFLKKTGATAYGLLNIILASVPFSLFLYNLVTANFKSSFITATLSIMAMLCSAVGFILTAIVAFNFSGYINKHINGQVFKHEYKATAPQPAFTPQIQQNYNGAPVDTNNNYVYPQQTKIEKTESEKPFTNYHVKNPSVNRNAYVKIENKNIQTVDDLSSIPTPEQPETKPKSYDETENYLF